MNPELKSEILAELRKVRAPTKVARNLGVDLRMVLGVVDEIGGIRAMNREERWGGFGRPELKKYTVARKRAYQTWDNNDPKITKARKDYEAGTHEMCTARDGNWLILYSIPRKKVEPRPDYFKPQM